MVKKSTSFKKTIKEAAFKSVFGLFPKDFIMGRLFDLEDILNTRSKCHYDSPLK